MMGPMNLPARSLTAQQVRDYWGSFDNHHKFFFGIFDPAAGTPIGFWLVECEALHDVATFHLAIDPGFWRSGCALETAIALFDWLFAVRKIAKLNVLTLPGNTAMRGLLARLGFTEEGLLRQEVRNFTGEGRLDQLRFGLLPNDWRAARQHLNAIQEK
jgi:RimJ/RimL family protein N-acetyltransferase